MKIAVMPGDGIGPEVVAQALKVLRVVAPQAETQEAPIGEAGIQAHGVPLPEPTLELARKADAILFGAVGVADEAAIPREQRPGTGLLQLREALTLYANFRPAYMFPELIGASTLRPEVVDGLDIVIVRELNGDAYFGQPRGFETNQAGERVGFNTMRYSESEVERVAHAAFRAARRRHHKLCSVDKANVLEASQLWREVVTRVGSGLPGRRTEPSLRGRRRDDADATAQAVRRDRHGQPVRRHSLGRRGHADRFDWHAAFGLAGL